MGIVQPMVEAEVAGLTSRPSAQRPALSHREPSPPAPSPAAAEGRLTAVALAFAMGIAIGWHQPVATIWPWLIAATAALLLGAASWLRARSVLAIVALAGGAACLGAAWVTIRHERAAADDLASHVPSETTLVRMQGRALAAPVMRSRNAGSMARFDYREPAAYLPMKVDALLSGQGDAHAARGSVLVRVDQSIAPLRAGDHLVATGYFSAPASPRNPGEFDFARYARSLGQAGILSVPSRELLQVRPAKYPGAVHRLLGWREDLRRRAGAWLLADLPQTDPARRAERDALLADLMLGAREPQIDELQESFRRVGLSHILAISGFHLGVLAAFVLIIARLLGGERRWHGWLVVGAVALYLLLVEIRMPVLRAGVMTMVGSAGMIAGNRLRVGGLVALSGIALLLWRPDQLFTPGFQLTFGVVLALLHLAPAVRRRWFGPFKRDAASVGRMAWQWLAGAISAAAVAWVIATPIAAWHFGMISPAGAPMSVVAVPLAAIVLALGFLKMALASVLPSAALLVGAGLSIAADTLLAIVSAIDRLPGTAVHVPFPSAAWGFAALAWGCWWALERDRVRLRVSWAVAAALALWLAWPMFAQRDAGSLRIDMLAVGDGSCYIVRSGPSTVIFDAGSSSDLDAGRRTIVPALRRLGVRSIEAIAVSHPDLDHFSAVLELVDEFAVGRVLVTPQLLAAAEQDPGSPLDWLLDGLTRRRVAVQAMYSGHTLQFGAARWAWLHPPADARFRAANDGSMVVRIDASSRSVLLTGDIQQEAMAALLRSGDAALQTLRADAVELPHHGSHHELAEAFIAQVRPAIVFQSTGWSRWQRDRWSGALADMERLVTARDGACTIIIDADGRIRTERFIAPAER